MKQQSSYNGDGESRDLLLFDYLEGNLTEERARALEAALATDPELSAELEHWKESFVVQDFYATGALEEQLLRDTGKGFSLSGPAGGFMLVLVVSLFSFLPISEQQEKALPVAVVTLAPPAVTEMPAHEKFEEKQERSSGVKRLHKPSDKPEITNPEITTAAEEQPVISIAEQQEEVLPVLNMLEPGEADYAEEAAIEDVDIKQVKQKKLHQPKQISRKKQKQIRRMKEKALQRKQANEFIKGNRPYVVPLDTKNF